MKNRKQRKARPRRPAVVLLAVDVSIPPVQRRVRLQLALTLAAAQTGVVPHPPRSQQEEAVEQLLATSGTHHWLLDGHSCWRLSLTDGFNVSEHLLITVMSHLDQRKCDCTVTEQEADKHLNILPTAFNCKQIMTVFVSDSATKCSLFTD